MCLCNTLQGTSTHTVIVGSNIKKIHPDGVLLTFFEKSSPYIVYLIPYSTGAAGKNSNDKIS